MDFLFESKNEFGNVSVYHLHLSKYTGKIWLVFFCLRESLTNPALMKARFVFLLKFKVSTFQVN